MKKLIKIETVFLTLALLLMLVGCNGAGTNGSIGDGQVDAVETAVIRLAVGAAMTAKPETVAPAYAVSKAVLTIMDAENPVMLTILEAAVDKEIKKLDLTVYEKQSVMDLVNLVKANIVDRVGGLVPERKFVVVRAVIEIVHDSAKARLNL